MNFLKRNRANKYGKHIFTFPDGEKLYQLKEDYFEKLPNAKLEYIQENTNYIAHLGISKYSLHAGMEKIRGLVYEAKALKGLKQDNEKKLDEIEATVKAMEIKTGEYDKTQDHIITSLFDMFFFFEDENIFEWSEEALEKKRHYLHEYPYFRNFFFRKLESYITDYKITYDNVTRYAILQTGIQELIKGLEFTNTNEGVTG